MTGIKHQVLREEVMLYVAHPDHPCIRNPEPLADETLRRYRAIAVADTALRKPVLTYRLLDKQPRLTVSTMGRSGTPCWRASASAPCRNAGLKRDIKAGRLKVIGPEYRHQIQVVPAWRQRHHGQGQELAGAGDP